MQTEKLYNKTPKDLIVLLSRLNKSIKATDKDAKIIFSNDPEILGSYDETKNEITLSLNVFSDSKNLMFSEESFVKLIFSFFHEKQHLSLIPKIGG